MTDPFSPEAAPRADGRRYPGAWPDDSCVVTFDEVRPLDEPLWGLAPVLSVGSNASPAQLRHKFLTHPEDLAIAMSRARVRGLLVGFCRRKEFYDAHAAAPVLDGAAETELMVQWLDEDSLAALDATEVGYERRWLTPDEHGVEVLVAGRRLEGVWAYCLDDVWTVGGVPIRMVTPWGDVAPGPLAAASQDELDAILAREGLLPPVR